MLIASGFTKQDDAMSLDSHMGKKERRKDAKIEGKRKRKKTGWKARKTAG